jgi:hypothetical protein
VKCSRFGRRRGGVSYLGFRRQKQRHIGFQYHEAAPIVVGEACSGYQNVTLRWGICITQYINVVLWLRTLVPGVESACYFQHLLRVEWTRPRLHLLFFSHCVLSSRHCASSWQGASLFFSFFHAVFRSEFFLTSAKKERGRDLPVRRNFKPSSPRWKSKTASSMDRLKGVTIFKAIMDVKIQRQFNSRRPETEQGRGIPFRRLVLVCMLRLLSRQRK